MSTSKRLDQVLVEKDLISSRSQARDLILRGVVEVNGSVAKKPGQKVFDSDEIKITQENLYVGRGALKLKPALDHFKVDCHKKIALDLGASTGGFTEVLLEEGAIKVFAVDVGRDQLAAKLKADSRVVNLEGINVKDSHSFIPDSVDIIVCDLSFIGLSTIAKEISCFFSEETQGVFLVKPQFELGKELIGKGGIASDGHGLLAVEMVKNSFLEEGLLLTEHIESAIKGKTGNQEFLVHVIKSQ